MAEAAKALRNAAGNYYVNDKSTGSIVAQQPFGGARASGKGASSPPIGSTGRGRITWRSPLEVRAVELNVECGSVTSTRCGTVIEGEEWAECGAWIWVHWDRSQVRDGVVGRLSDSQLKGTGFDTQCPHTQPKP